jgi:hypothetical protein
MKMAGGLDAGTEARGMRFIDVSGVGNTGKSAAVDLMREIDGVFAPEYWFEFDILRVPGGLLELRHHLLEDWSPVRSHAAYHAFREVVRKMGRNPAWWDLPGLFDATSQRYDRRFHGRFIERSEAFVKSFLTGSYRAEWPYDDLRQNAGLRFARKILCRLGLRKQLTRDVLLLDGADFDHRAQDYLLGLYASIVPAGTSQVVLNNGFEPFNPRPSLDMLAGSRQIVVTRDPRDVYVSGLNSHNVGGSDNKLLAFDNDGMNKSFLATDDLELFVKRFKLYHDNLYRQPDERVLRIGFEQLIADYDRAVPAILAFLDIEPSRHSRARTVFVPERSAKNVGIWRQYSRKDEIAYIEKHLDAYLVGSDHA